MHRWAVVIEHVGRNRSAYVPDLPGCVATAASARGALREIRKAIEFHLEGLRADGSPVPRPTTRVADVTVRP